MGLGGGKGAAPAPVYVPPPLPALPAAYVPNTPAIPLADPSLDALRAENGRQYGNANGISNADKLGVIGQLRQKQLDEQEARNSRDGLYTTEERSSGTGLLSGVTRGR